MRKTVKLIVILLLLLNGTGALYGGFQFINDPTGSSMQMPLSYLEHSPFYNYLIPGIILLLVNGLFSFITISVIMLRIPKNSWFVLAQGILLGGWIVIQLLMLRIFYATMHLTFLAIAICLIICGLYLYKNE